MDTDWKYRAFTITGKVYSPNESVAAHTVYWSLDEGDNMNELIIESVQIENGDTNG